MRRLLFIHIGILVSFLILTSIVKGWLSITYWPFWVGGVVGMLLPALDHLIYVYFLYPQELTSQRVRYSLSKKDVSGAIKLLFETRRERIKLIFHTVFFQGIFLLLTVFVLTSSGSIFGRGLVLGFSLDLLVDQIMDFGDFGNISNWFTNNIFMPLKALDYKKSLIYWVTILLILIILSTLF